MWVVGNRAITDLAFHVVHDPLPQCDQPSQVVLECLVHDPQDAFPACVRHEFAGGNCSLCTLDGCDAKVAHDVAKHRGSAERLGSTADAEMIHQHTDLGIAQSLDGHEWTMAVLARDLEHPAGLVRQVVSLLHQRA